LVEELEVERDVKPGFREGSQAWALVERGKQGL
jgi:hypothetical protein